MMMMMIIIIIINIKDIYREQDHPRATCGSELAPGLYLTGGSGGLTLPQKVLQNLFGVDSNPLRTSRFHFLAKPVYLCTIIRRLRLYRDRRDLI